MSCNRLTKARADEAVKALPALVRQYEKLDREAFQLRSKLEGELRRTEGQRECVAQEILTYKQHLNHAHGTIKVKAFRDRYWEAIRSLPIGF